jgi:hypothetical protein
MFHVEHFDQRVPRGTLLPGPHGGTRITAESSGQGERHAILASLTGSQSFPNSSFPAVGGDVRRGRRKCFTWNILIPPGVFHMEHSSGGISGEKVLCAPAVGRIPVLCSPHGMFQTGVFHVEHIRQLGWSGISLGESIKKQLYGPWGGGTCPWEAKRSVFHVGHYSILAIPRGVHGARGGSF